MRISDWSSDVCSSDLTNQGVIRRLAQNNCVAFNKKPKLGTILGILTIARATKNKDIARIEPFGGFARANSVDAARVRSEEHTSELQSLMRISYAVFCLKTNTTTTI